MTLASLRPVLACGRAFPRTSAFTRTSVTGRWRRDPIRRVRTLTSHYTRAWPDSPEETAVELLPNHGLQRMGDRGDLQHGGPGHRLVAVLPPPLNCAGIRHGSARAWSKSDHTRFVHTICGDKSPPLSFDKGGQGGFCQRLHT